MPRVWILMTVVIFQSVSVSCAEYPFRNTSLSWAERVDDLVGRLTVEELMFQMSRGGAGPQGGPAPAIDRLQIKPYSWNTECLRGDAGAGEATSFPQSIGLAATFNASLIYLVAEATAIEVHAKYNDYTRRGLYGDHKGISCFSPVLNIMRHPLWGRNQETYGEDPFLSGEYASYFVRGLQGDHPRYIRANAGCKHFDVHGGPENIPVSRFSFNAEVSDRDWRLTFLPAFRKCVRAGGYSMMCSFNSINGVPACANSQLLTKVLRDEWKFSGYVVSDQGAIENIIAYHRYRNTTVDTVAASVNAGCNLELSSSLKKPVYFSMVDALKQGKLTESTIRSSAKPLFYTRMRLGEFDPPEMNPYGKLDLSVLQSPKHRELSMTAAMSSFVLLKNVNNYLPFEEPFVTIAVVGPMADNAAQQFGDYASTINPKYTTTPLDALRNMSYHTVYAKGCNDNRCNEYNRSEILDIVSGSYDFVFVVLGTGVDIESEGNDRMTTDLPGKQLQLLQDAANGNSLVVLLLFNAGPVDISWADKSDNVSCILECFFPAQATGEALHRVLYRQSSNTSSGFDPAGRLPFTWHLNANEVPPITDYSMQGRTYRYFDGEPLYPFGYGLSYTYFQYLKLDMNTSIQAGQPHTVNVELTCTGPVGGVEVIQVYISWMDTKEKMPRWQLVAFDRIFIKIQEKITLKLVVKAESMAVWNDKKGFVIEPGRIKVYAGGQQPNQKRSVGSNVLSGIFNIFGTKVLGRY